MTEYWTEWSKSPYHGKPPIFVKLDDIMDNVGFRSIYAYSTDTAKQALQEGAITGVSKTKPSVYSDTLFIDIDDKPQDAEIFIDYLTSMGVNCKVYDSGNRSVHIHIDIWPMEGVSVPYSQKRFLAEICLLLNIQLDLSFYHYAGLYRLPGTVHAKTGRKKELVEDIPGAKLEILTREQYTETIEDRSNATLWRMLYRTITEGNGRHFHAAKIAWKAKELGYCTEEINKMVEVWNKNYCNPPLPLTKLQRKIYGTS